MKRGLIFLRSVYLKIAICIEVFLLAFTFCVFPAKAVSTVNIVLDTSYLSGFLQSNTGTVQNLRTTSITNRGYNVNYIVGNTTYNCSWIEFDLGSAYNSDSQQWGEGQVYLKFKLDGSGKYLDNPLVSCSFIVGICLPQYGYTSLDCTYMSLDGGDFVAESGSPDYLGHSSYGVNFYKFDSFVSEGTITGSYFQEVTLVFNWRGNPNNRTFQLCFPNDNHIIVESYSADNQGIVNGLEDVRNEIGKTNDLIEQPLGSDEEKALDDQSATNDSVRQEAESMVSSLDQFQAPTDDIQGVNDSIAGVIDDHPEEVDLLTLDFSDSSEFFNTVTIVGVPGLGICFLGYVLYGKKG